MSWVAILVDSDASWSTLQVAADVFKDLDIPFEVRLTCAQQAPAATADYVQDAQARECGAFVCAGGSSHVLANAVAALSVRPVIELPIVAEESDVADSAVNPVSAASTAGATPVAFVGAGRAGARKAASFVAQIFGVADPRLFDQLCTQKVKAAARIEKRNRKLQDTLQR